MDVSFVRCSLLTGGQRHRPSTVPIRLSGKRAGSVHAHLIDPASHEEGMIPTGIARESGHILLPDETSLICR